jgi:hypothetical protein
MHLIQDLPFITALSMAVASHRKPLSAGTCYGSDSALDSDKTQCMRVIVGTGTPKRILWNILAVKYFGPCQ